MTKPEIRERLTTDQAVERNLVPAGHAWDEDTQQAVPVGQALMHAALTKPVDLERNLEEWRHNRATLVRFIQKYLQEADYKTDGYPKPGCMHDYYKLPSYDKKTLTKQGAEKIAQLFRFARASTETVHREVSKECATAIVRVTLWDHYRRPVGSGEAACSTAEKGFSSGASAKKYGGDYRAALNDVISRAGKRAFIQAVVYAIAGDELFETQASSDTNDDEQVERRPAAAAGSARFPEKFGKLGGKRIADVETEELTRVAKWIRTEAKKPEKLAGTLQAIDDELENRRSLDQDEGDEEYTG